MFSKLTFNSHRCPGSSFPAPKKKWVGTEIIGKMCSEHKAVGWRWNPRKMSSEHMFVRPCWYRQSGICVVRRNFLFNLDAGHLNTGPSDITKMLICFTPDCSAWTILIFVRWTVWCTVGCQIIFTPDSRNKLGHQTLTTTSDRSAYRKGRVVGLFT